MTSQKIFGTDGIRGRFGDGFLTPACLFRLARAVGLWIQINDPKGPVCFARDTRASGPLIEEIFKQIFHFLGIPYQSLGILPTPALAYHGQKNGGYGVMISASHNLGEDNGIKLFGKGGEKLSEEQERKIEEIFSRLEVPTSFEFPSSPPWEEVCQQAEGDYRDFILSTLPMGFSLHSLKIVLDCAHGAAFRVAPDVLRSLGAETIVVGAAPDGMNINKECGALNLDVLSSIVRQERADVGIALDGDGDRLLLVDAEGTSIDGDQILALLACTWQEEERLPIPKVVSTVMANGSLEAFLKTKSILLERTPVGDRYIGAVLSKENLPLGAEPSGHVILKEFHGSGDGLLVALQVLRIALKKGRGLQQLFPLFTPFFQKLYNIPMPSLNLLYDSKTQNFLFQSRTNLEAEGGRLLVRPSGTEPLLRLFVEGPSEPLVKKYLEELLKFFENIS
jgi:phosphoglucosamine mutase